MSVDGEEITNANEQMVNFNSGHTPILRKIDHRYGRPGDLVTVTGKIFTKNIGPGGSDLDNFDELDKKSLQNLFFGTAACDFMDELGNPLGAFRDLKDNGDFSNEGNVTCKTSGSFIGPMVSKIH